MSEGQQVQDTTDTTETETQNTAGVEVVETKKTLEQLTPEELIDYVRTLRKENAAHRTAKQQKDEKLKEFESWQDSQKTELQRAQEEAESLRNERLDLLRLNATLAFGLDEDMAEFVKGETPDEIEASAKKLASKSGASAKRATSAGDMFAGNRGTPVSQGPKDPSKSANDFMSQLIWGSGR